MEETTLEARTKFNFFVRCMIALTGADPQLLKLCPPRDIGSIVAVGLLMLGVWLYQLVAFSLAAHIMLAQPGEIRPELIVGAALLASIVLAFDSEVVMRTSWHVHGIAELLRGGVDVSSGIWMKIKNVLFIVLRVALAVVFATLTAVFLSLYMFQKDIDDDLENVYRQANAPLFSAAGVRLETELQKTAGDLAASEQRATDAGQEVTRLRAVVVDPVVDDPQFDAALGRVKQLASMKTDADQALMGAQQFASDELAGTKGTSANSGVPGFGPVRRAAEERVASAKERVRSADAQLEEAQANLQSLQAAHAAAVEQKRREAQTRLSEVMKDIADEQARRSGLEAQHQHLVDGRESIIGAMVLADPSRVPKRQGFLANLEALYRLSHEPQNRTVIILIDLGAMGIELASVLAKLIAFVPTMYATLVAREAFLQALQAARSIQAEIDGTPPERPSLSDGDEMPPPDGEAGPGHEEPALAAAPQGPVDPAKRKRGRPPKPKVFEPAPDEGPESDETPDSEETPKAA